ncbi:MAG: zinc ABC transporter substrate-binding protein [Actinobacteria bacterium]|nr:zinc ABC transporter substrate-binding protein [Actinomycetota bacterium]
MPASRPRLIPVVLASIALVSILLAGCGGSGSDATAGGSGGSGGKLRVVAAEDFWGSIAEQLGGEKVAVTNIITNPAADPHDYEPTAEDAKTMAGAEMSIVNGIGYDEWASKLLAASPAEGRIELTVGDVVGLSNGDNPHQWYSPESVHKVIDQIVADYKEALPGNAAYFEARKKALETEAFAEYDELIEAIKAEYDGTPVGASESIFEPLAPALGLKLITPKGFMDGISEGTEPTPQEKSAADEQVKDNQIQLWVYNSQNATPDVKRLNEEVEAAGIPIATVTETMTPEGASFEEWMVRELKGIQKALGEGQGS